MSTIQSNRISAVLEIAEKTEITDALNLVAARMPFLTGLTKEERMALPKMNNSNKTFTEDAINSAGSNPDLVPAYFDVEEMQRDFVLFQELDKLVLKVAQLHEKLDDTRMLAGSEAYMAALTFYGISGQAAKAGVPGADEVYKLLRARFEGQGNFTEDPTGEVPATPAS